MSAGMSKHTSGPWKYLEWGARIVSSDIGSAQVLIATVAINTRRDEGRHNASVLAAAPDLLAMLAEAHDIIDAIGQPETAKVAARMRATISQAKGEA